MHFGPSEEDATAQIYMAEDFKAATDAILTRVVTMHRTWKLSPDTPA
jgi:hypothetical protein